MGYFSNGEEGAMYEAEFCERCIHYHDPDATPPVDCAVLAVHSLFNYDQYKNPDLKKALTLLIPQGEDGLVNAQCKMFIIKDGVKLKES